MSTLHFDPFSVTTFQDPYPIYMRLRAEAPVYHNAEGGFWAVSRYEDVIAVSRDWETFSVSRGVDIDTAGDVLGGGFFLAKDPLSHDTLRAVIRGAFGLKTMRERFEPEVRREVEAMLATLASTGRCDLAADICWRLPPLVMSILMGFPREDCERPRHLSFGEGVHFCLGSPLARMQMKFVMEGLLRESRRYELAGGAERQPSHAVRRFTSLARDLRVRRQRWQ